MQLPVNWAQLPPQTVLEIAPYALSDTIDNRVRCLEILCSSEQVVALLDMTHKEVNNILPQLNWIYIEPLTEPVVNGFWLGEDFLLLPQTRLKCCNLIEWIYAEAAFDEITGTGAFDKYPPNAAAIDKLILALCRPKDANLDMDSPHWQGDMREYFSPILNERREKSKKMDSVPLNFKCFFLLFYLGCKKYIQKQYSILFSSDSMSADEQQSTIDYFSSPMPNFGWTGLLFDLAETGLFGDNTATQYTDLHTILIYLSKKQFEYREVKRKTKQNNK